VVVPQWLQATLGYSATKAGFVTAMHAVAAVMSAGFAARLMTKVDPRLLICLGVSWMAITSVIRAQWTSGVDFYGLAWPMFIQGFGIPFMMIPLTSISLGSVLPKETASAAGLQNFVRTMAIAVATSIVLTIWGDSQRVARTELVASMHPDAAQATLATAGLGADQSAAMLSNIVDREAVTMAVDHTFMVAAVILAIAAAIVWLSPKVKPTGPMATGH
jgi:DHA2 family multidrug resistance protein